LALFFLVQKIKELISVLDLRKDESIERTFKGVAKNFREAFAELVQGGHGSLVMMKKRKVGLIAKILVCLDSSRQGKHIRFESSCAKNEKVIVQTVFTLPIAVLLAWSFNVLEKVSLCRQMRWMMMTQMQMMIVTIMKDV
jgi:hypothetical protein